MTLTTLNLTSLNLPFRSESSKVANTVPANIMMLLYARLERLSVASCSNFVACIIFTFIADIFSPHVLAKLVQNFQNFQLAVTRAKEVITESQCPR